MGRLKEYYGMDLTVQSRGCELSTTIQYRERNVLGELFVSLHFVYHDSRLPY